MTGVAAASVPLLAGNNWGSDVSVEGFKRDPDTDSNARYNQVSAGYFRTLGIPLMAGREFTTADTATAPKVAIVNEAFTKKFNLGRNAVGKHISARETTRGSSTPRSSASCRTRSTARSSRTCRRSSSAPTVRPKTASDR